MPKTKKKENSRTTKLKTAKTSRKKIHKIVAGLMPLAVEIGSINRDPKNARDHDAVNLDSIRYSLKKYGQRKPIVVNNKDNLIEAGNGTHEVAEEMGWTHIAVLFVRDDLNTAMGYSIADNRAAELARWNYAVLRPQLERLKMEEMDISFTGFSDIDLEEMPNPSDYDPDGGGEDPEGGGGGGGGGPGDGLTAVRVEFIPEDYVLFVEAMGHVTTKATSASNATALGLKISAIIKKASDAGLIS